MDRREVRNEERGLSYQLWPGLEHSPRVAACQHSYRFVLMCRLGDFAPVKIFACHKCGHHRII